MGEMFLKWQSTAKKGISGLCRAEEVNLFHVYSDFISNIEIAKIMG